MDRAGGWYKRRVQAILFVIALALVIGINADSYAIGQRLWKDEALRSAVVAQANKTVAAGEAKCVTSSAGKGETAQAAACVGEVKALALPLGWSSSTSPHSLGAGIGKVHGPARDRVRADPRRAVLVRPARQGRAHPRERPDAARETVGCEAIIGCKDSKRRRF